MHNTLHMSHALTGGDNIASELIWPYRDMIGLLLCREIAFVASRVCDFKGR